MAYFPNHEPNTCPPLTEGNDKETPMADVIENGVSKIMSAIQYLSAWPAEGKTWVKTEYAKGWTGAKNIAETLAKDQTGHIGLKKIKQGNKRKIVSELMKQGKFVQRLTVNVEKLGGGSPSASSATTKAMLQMLFGRIIGWILCMLINQNVQEQEL